MIHQYIINIAADIFFVSRRCAKIRTKFEFLSQNITFATIHILTDVSPRILYVSGWSYAAANRNSEKAENVPIKTILYTHAAD